MDDSADSRDVDSQPTPPRPVRPSSARPSAAREEEPRAAKAPAGKPTPVRAMAGVEAPPPPVEPDIEEAALTVDGAEWTVRVAGRSGGARSSDTPLLLLGFWPADSDDGERVREALVVGRSLAEMTPVALDEAFASSTPPPPPREVVSESTGRGRRGRGRRSPGRGS